MPKDRIGLSLSAAEKMRPERFPRAHTNALAKDAGLVASRRRSIRHARRDGAQCSFEALPNRAESGDDANGDDGCDEAIFNSRCARLVLHETRKHVHSYSPKLIFKWLPDPRPAGIFA